MKVLIIGKNSYIGNHIDEWLTKAGHEIEQLDVLTQDWQNYNYKPYDAIVHVAGIVHRPDCKDWDLYYNVNTRMPIEIAKRFKDAGKQYIYFSTMGVYDADKSLRGCIIDENSILNTEFFYGKSKLLAEKGLKELEGDGFNVAFVRPPSVYGKGCKGGYITGFTNIVRLLPIIPRAYLNARQSFIYIDNLSECIRLILENNLNGAFCPQDDEIPNANELFSAIANGLGKKYRDSRLLGLLMQAVSFIPLVTKAYGGIAYDRKLSNLKGENYVVVPFKEGIKRTVGK